MLEQINGPEDIKRIPEQRLPQLAEEIRKFLVEKLSETGGHLASNLGTVELTIALHRVLNLPNDKLIWDVGHQAYTHKILTGRKEEFDRLRMEGGISGFPRRTESACDSFDTGHSSTSISAGLGYVQARDLKSKDYTVVSVIGDGALTGGMAYEALNNASNLKTNFIIVLNDNNMSISPSVGGISSYLAEMRTASAYTGLKTDVTTALEKIPGVGKGMVDAIRKTKSSIKQFVIPGMFFENMGITYLGPVDGHDIKTMTRVFQDARRVEGPVIVHVITQKGRGYLPALRHPSRFHGTSPFEIDTGIPKKHTKPTWTDIFSTVMRKMGDREPDVVAVTAAMKEGVGLKRFANMFPERFFDVGIAEAHAVTFAAGLSLGGLIPVVAIYSTFLQRAFDQIIHDVCMQNLHVVFAVDRAGLVGADGRTHQGVFDLSYLGMMPNMTVMAPKNIWELSDMMKYAVHASGPVAIRYPRGEACDGMKEHRERIEPHKAEVIHRGEKIAILAVGNMVSTAGEAVRDLQRQGINPTLVNMRFVKPFDKELVKELALSHDCLITVEENAISGGFGEQILVYAEEEKLKVEVEIMAVPDQFVSHGSVKHQQEITGLDTQGIVSRILLHERFHPKEKIDAKECTNEEESLSGEKLENSKR